MKLEDILQQGEQELDAAYQPRSGFVGGAALWILHLCKGLFLLFSAAHGISAALNYAGNSDWQKMLQVAGVITIELTLLSIYIGFITNSIRGSKQRLVAGAAYAITFGLAVMGVIVDSQMNAGGHLSASLAAYLTWGLPIAPAIVALASGFIHFLAPDVERQKKEMDANDLQTEADFKALINQKRMSLTARRLQHHLEFEAQKDLLKEMFIGYQDEGVRRAIRARAAQRLPALLEDMGIYMDEPRQLIDVTPQPRIEPMQLDPDEWVDNAAASDGEQKALRARLDEFTSWLRATIPGLRAQPDGDVPDAVVDAAAERLSAELQPAEAQREPHDVYVWTGNDVPWQFLGRYESLQAARAAAETYLSTRQGWLMIRTEKKELVEYKGLAPQEQQRAAEQGNGVNKNSPLSATGNRPE